VEWVRRDGRRRGPRRTWESNPGPCGANCEVNYVPAVAGRWAYSRALVLILGHPVHPLDGGLKPMVTGGFCVTNSK
jgi:hypothetical protein